MDDSLVYRKSGRGVAQLAATHNGALSRPQRHVLIVLDGRRTIAELCGLFGAETVQRVVPELVAKGFAKQVDTAAAAAWDGAVTQLYVRTPAAERPRPVPRQRRLDGHPLALLALAVALAIGSSYWATHRYRSQADAAWRMDRALALRTPIDAYGASTSTDAIDSTGPAPVKITPISRLPAVSVSQPAAATTPARSATRAAAREHLAAVRSQAQRASPDHAGPIAAQSTPMEGSTAAAAVKVGAADRPATQALPAPGATAAEASAAAVDPPAAAPIAAPGPVAAADPPAAAPEQVAMVAPAQSASDSIGLRPLRHDPPRFPAQALRDGITESQVRVRLWVTPEGKVDQVDILQATPRGVFDDEVRRALSLWSFEAPGRPMEQIVDLTLRP